MPKATYSIFTIVMLAALEESSRSIEKAKAVLEKHPWYAHQWPGEA